LRGWLRWFQPRDIDGRAAAGAASCCLDGLLLIPGTCIACLTCAACVSLKSAAFAVPPPPSACCLPAGVAVCCAGVGRLTFFALLLATCSARLLLRSAGRRWRAAPFCAVWRFDTVWTTLPTYLYLHTHVLPFVRLAYSYFITTRTAAYLVCRIARAYAYHLFARKRALTLRFGKRVGLRDVAGHSFAPITYSA